MMKVAGFVALFVGSCALQDLMLKPLKLKKQTKQNDFCMDGFIAPQVFLSGYQKAGSSSLWTDLMRNYNLAAAHPIQDEEGFREKEVSFFHNEQRYKKGKKFYLKHFPGCKEYGMMQQVIDGSPNAIYQTDTNAPINDVKIPAIERMKKLYDEKNLTKKLKFVVIVRDAANRMESSYYHFHEGVHKNFDGYVAATLEEAKNWTYKGGATSPSPNLYWPSMYARHLKKWLSEFDPSQFALVTLTQYKTNPKQTLEFISKRLGIPPRTTIGKEASSVENARQHAKMKPETKKNLQQFFAPMDKELADLVKEHQIGFASNSIGKVPGIFLQTGEGSANTEAIKDAFDENVHFMMPNVEEAILEEYRTMA